MSVCEAREAGLCGRERLHAACLVQVCESTGQRARDGQAEIPTENLSERDANLARIQKRHSNHLQRLSDEV